MPYGFERLNERSQRPNALINFIKPLSGPDEALATEFLSRIAAQCYPVMKANHISVMSLEEYEPNPEFLGRNFNAGECIQLVLKNKQGQWLSFRYVQMVMMHELAHCKQMNHGRDFWKVRNNYAETMEGLWKKNYSGEGIWGRGQDLGTGIFLHNGAVEPGSLPQHLCGGTYRRRGRKRKRGAQADTESGQRLTYAERQQRRIARKFGKHGEGTELGDDELVRGAYEQGNRHYGKPRVAGSKRGRELRAQAALARLEAAKTEQQHAQAASRQSDIEEEEGSEESDFSDDNEGAKDLSNYFRVCGEEDENENGPDASQEMSELLALARDVQPEQRAEKQAQSTDGNPVNNGKTSIAEDVETESESEEERIDVDNRSTNRIPTLTQPEQVASKPATITNTTDAPSSTMTEELGNTARCCPICSLENGADSLLCSACSNVLRPDLVKGTWRCDAESCRSTLYLNAGDVRRCGLCGGVKPLKHAAVTTTGGGTMSANILRWD